MGNLNRGRYTVQLNGPWRLYNRICPPGWTMIGTIQRDVEIGALARSTIGVYAQLNAGVIRSLDQRKVLAAMK